MSQPTFTEYVAQANLESKPHQIEGVKWGLNKELEGTDCNGKIILGGLIADEMGLGKTIQMVGIIYSNPLPKQTLIVLPRSLVEQWYNFILKTTDFNVCLYHGTKKPKTVDALKIYDIIITTYGLIAVKDIPTILHQIKWNRLIFDEAHHLRNKKTIIFNGAKKLSSEIRWLMTGTPIQNSKTDFYSLCEQLDIPRSYYTNPNNLIPIAKNLILKRTKKEIHLKLPPIVEHKVRVKWDNPNEQNLSEEIHSALNFSNVPNTKHQIGQYFGNATLPLLIRARQICIYPPLLKDSIGVLLKNGIINIEDNPELAKMIKEGSNFSSKLNQVIEQILNNKDNGNRKLIFCHYRGEIDAIKEKLEKENMKVINLDGRTKQQERESILTAQDIDVLILQIQTGCEGLNLQHFNEIYFISPHWNPAVEDQAIARAHRIGQDKPTHIYRFNMSSFDDKETTRTLDEHSRNVQNIKRKTMKILEVE